MYAITNFEYNNFVLASQTITNVFCIHSVIEGMDEAEVDTTCVRIAYLLSKVSISESCDCVNIVFASSQAIVIVKITKLI
jgi:hypothetical protein